MAYLSEQERLNSAINEDIRLIPYDALWAKKFSDEKARLLGIFSKDILELEHIGSTAIVGLSAKPIIDMMGSVVSMAAADSIIIPLCDFGYVSPDESNNELPERRWLMRYSNGHRTHHLHLVQKGSYSWKRTIKFRDVLINNSEVATQYEKLKITLAKQNINDRNAYIKGKTAFIEDVVQKY